MEETKKLNGTEPSAGVAPEGSPEQNEKTQAKSASSPPILCLGAPRTGTASLMKALQILGYPNVHHGWDACEEYDLQWQWPIFDRANDATFPNLPTYRGTPFSRDEWDEVFGRYDAVSDIASHYAESLIPAYPDAKVILVERDIEKWYNSMVPVVKDSTNPRYRAFVTKVSYYTGYTSGPVCFRMQQGWTRSDSNNDVVKNLKTAYVRHYKYVREAVPSDQLLDYKLTDGWEPLCRFLGKEVPDVPFPHVNDAAEYKARGKRLRNKILKAVARKFFCPCLG
ncbi:hypothetical protein LCI18_004867 [Fusarium solani-melongenae]|uniref:Uncharacterized protein n=1 Tax=Fusarium solani subsp. cucurbitae TaxID=2747967 RepID=A0ACD3YY89_FUSSC|nr:hypothetical protein LCI18_004867 [Fusarium solani-melongenae]